MHLHNIMQSPWVLIARYQKKGLRSIGLKPCNRFEPTSNQDKKQRLKCNCNQQSHRNTNFPPLVINPCFLSEPVLPNFGQLTVPRKLRLQNDHAIYLPSHLSLKFQLDFSRLNQGIF